ncbi:DUF3153 domain-containing protein [Calothrix sp. NIES-3974]|uniref:DUF3153 domain-containing protein n=1 Tax=Calothrix sp. NIES-3974 TaxID=2005462 RepID=UPI000B61CEF9|nr:hypothetical protein NIES3974_13720 [Calothrix sp. NIES-3974]
MRLTKVVALIKLLWQSLIRRRLVVLIAAIAMLLSGCVEYDVGVKFDGANRGEFVQHIRLGEKLTSFSSEPVYEWLNSIERRTRQLEGKSQRISQSELIATIPFNSGQELQTKFNQFFHPQETVKNQNPESEQDLPKIESNLLLFQNNFLLLVRNRLIYDLDLRSLALISSNGNTLTNTSAILDLDFSLKTPWGAKNIPSNENAIAPEQNGKKLVWHLVPGTLNHIEVVFWLPNGLGIGGLFILIFVATGYYLRYFYLPNPFLQDTQTDTTPQTTTAVIE